MSRHRRGDFLLFVQHHIDEEINGEKLQDFLHIATDGIAVGPSDPGILQQHHLMIPLDGTAGANTGDDGFAATAVTGEIMVINVADTDTEIRFNHGTKDLKGRSVGAHTHGNEIFGIGIHHPDAAENIAARQTFPFLIGLFPVGAQAADDNDILILHTGGIQLFQQKGQDLIAGTGTGDIADDDGRGLSGFGDLSQRRRVDGSTQGFF